MDPKQRLQLNFGGGYGNERNYDPSNSRVFPTTPSTFPQPVFGNQVGTTPNAYAQQGQSPYAGSSGVGYFPQMNDNRNPGYGGQQYQQYNQQNLASPQPAYQQRQGGYAQSNNNNDPTSGLAHQFSNQNLGPPPRQNNPYGRQPSPNSRFYSNPQQHGQQRGPTGYAPNQRTPPPALSPLSGPPDTSNTLMLSEDPPEKNPDKYAQNVKQRNQVLRTSVNAFFSQNIIRARERNAR